MGVRPKILILDHIGDGDSRASPADVGARGLVSSGNLDLNDNVAQLSGPLDQMQKLFQGMLHYNWLRKSACMVRFRPSSNETSAVNPRYPCA